MLFKSTLLSEASGSMAGLTFARNKGGMYIRQRAIPTNPGTPEQTAVRGAFEYLADMWKNGLTSTQRAGWELYAANVTMKNRLGASVKLSGMNHFIRTNLQGKILSSVIGTAPTTFNIGSLTTPSADTFAAGPPSTVNINYSAGDDWYTSGVPAQGHLYVYASRPQDTSVNFFKGPYQYAGKANGGTPSPLALTLPFNAVAGQRIFFYARALCSDGRLSDKRTFQLDA